MPITSTPSLRHDLYQVINEDTGIQTELVNKIIAPEMPTEQPSASAPVRKDGEKDKVPEDVRRNVNGSFNRVTLGYGEDSYTTEENGLEAEYNMTEKITMAKYFDIEFDHAQLVTQGMYLSRELKVVQAFQNAASFAAGNKQAAAAGYNSPSTSDPVLDFQLLSDKAQSSFRMKKEHCWATIHVDTAHWIIQLEKLRATSIYTSDPQQWSREQKAEYLRRVLDVGKIIIVDGSYNTSGIGEAAAWNDFWSKSSITMFRPPATGSTMSRPSFARQPVYTPYAKDLRMVSYPDMSRRKNIIGASDYRGLKMDYTQAVMLTGTYA